MTEPLSIMVGERMPIAHRDWSEGTVFEPNNNQLMLNSIFRTPTIAEQIGLRSGRMRIGLARGGTHTAFLLVAIAGLLADWADCPFAMGLRKDNALCGLPPRKPHEGFSLIVTLCDYDTRKVAALRFVTMTPKFSGVLERLVADQTAHFDTFTPEAHQAEIEQMYRRYRTPGDIAGHALITEVAGQPFPKED